MSLCPYCGTTYHSTYPPLTLSAKQERIYNSVLSGGQRGASAKKLIDTVWDGNPPKTAWGVLRVSIFEINRKIKERGQRIKGRRDVGYVLIKDDDTTEEDQYES